MFSYGVVGYVMALYGKISGRLLYREEKQAMPIMAVLAEISKM